jgi:dipeptidyl aminopeptidase/acylaminoacyl peptidase
MLSLSPTLLRGAFAALLALSAGAALAQAAPVRPPIAHFFDNPAFHSPLLSPDGKLLAVIIGSPGKRDGLAVIDLATNQVFSTARFPDADVGKVQWVNKQRLVFDTSDGKEAPGFRQDAPGLYAANFDGSAFKQLAQRRAWRKAQKAVAKDRLLPPGSRMLDQTPAQDSDAIYVVTRDPGLPGNKTNWDLLKVDTVTGITSKIEHPENTHQWMLDAKGEPRLIMTVERDTGTMRLRDTATGSWKDLATYKLYGNNRAAFSPVAFGADGTFYVTAQAGKDKTALHTYDLAAGKLSEQPLVNMVDYDFRGRLIFSNGKLIGFRALSDAETTTWFDPGMKALQDEVDKLLNNTINLISVAPRAETPWVLVESYSDTIPKTVRLFNSKTKAFNVVGSAYPGIRPEQMGSQEAVKYTARDGLEIPALLTMPPGVEKGKAPLVVLVHGGPYVRGSSWGWQPDVQFLASRGYAVLEPEFRGSTGFGAKHFRAGLKQWGLAMQNDIADGTRWAIAKGYADPKRVCIAGGSYGGYAALMGLVNDPDLYQCGINWIGVTDINLLYDGDWKFTGDASDTWLDYGLPELVGDQVKDAAQLKATSPLLQAARIKQPLLLAYGEVDQRVPLFHGEKFYQAVKPHNKDVEWVVYPGEGHGWALPQNRIDFWNRVEKFLDRQIGK